jgi:glycerol-3-phosphate dehydrogenase (NAD(P)+)
MIAVLGAGAFGTALAVALAQGGQEVRLWARSAAQVDEMAVTRRNDGRLPGVDLPETVSVTAELADLGAAPVLLLALPMQQLRGFLTEHGAVLDGRVLVACCKGLDLTTLTGPTGLIRAACPKARAAILTGPSFAADIARGMPTALTLAGDFELTDLQRFLSTPTLRIYAQSDVAGAELGGAVKNVIAIACGIVIGAGLGESARAALLTRGYAEMARLAKALGARPETLAGLSGLGDLVLTCTSPQSRNFRHGLAIGGGQTPDSTATVEGVATARALARLAEARGLDLPISSMVAAVVTHALPLEAAIRALMSRPLTQE